MIPSRKKKGQTHERSQSSWAFGGIRRVNSSSSLISAAGVSGGLPASSSRTIDMFKIEELCARSATVIFGPVSVFQGNVVMGAKTTLNNATVTITFQGVGQTKGVNAAFLTVTEELFRGDITPGRHDFLFGLQFPPVNLPPSSEDPGIIYNFVAKVAYGTDFHVAFVSKPFVVKFVPLVDPFAKPRPSSLDMGTPTEKSPRDGKKPNLKIDTAAATAPKRMSSYGLSVPATDSSNTVTVTSKDDELRIKMPYTLFLPGDEIVANLKLSIAKKKELPKSFTARVEEVRRFVIEQSGKDVQKTTEVVKILSSQKLALHWESNKKETGRLSSDPQNGTATPRASLDDSTPKPTATGQEGSRVSTEQSNKSHTSDIETFVTRTTIHIRLPNFHTFVSNSYLPTSRLPLTGAPDSATTPKSPVATAKGPPQGQGVSMDISHRLHITVHMPAGRMALKKPTIELMAPITLGNRDPKDSKRPHRNSNNMDSNYPLSKPSGNRRNSTSTNPSFLLTTAPEDSYPAESPGSGKSKVPSFRLNSFSEEGGESSAAGAAGSSSSIGGRSGSRELLSGSAIWDMPGSPLWMEVRNPEDMKNDIGRMATLAETSERPFFLKNEYS